MRHFIRKMIFCVFFFSAIDIIILVEAHSAEYYVSPTGTAPWVQSVNRSTSSSRETAMANAQAGDTVIFLEGKYDNIPYIYYDTPGLNPSNSGTEGNPIIFKSEIPLSAHLVVYTSQARINACGSQNQDWIVWDGFKIYGEKPDGSLTGGCAIFQSSNNCTLKNCELIGAEHDETGKNRELVRIDESTNILIQNCKIHGLISSLGEHNTSATKSYNSSNITIENCTIYDCTVGIYDKQGGNSNTYRYNLIYNCNHGFYIQSAVVDNGNHEIYQNIFVNNSSTAIRHPSGDSHASDNMQVYNNVIYGGYRGFAKGSAGDWSYWNNIVVTRGYSFAGFKEYGRPDYSDYQCFYDGQIFEVNLYVAGEATYTLLADWKSSGKLIGGGNPDLHSIYQNPLFVDPENYDFRLQSGSPCKGLGKDGKDMGAYPNRDDGTIIGYVGGGLPVPDVAAPPENARIE